MRKDDRIMEYLFEYKVSVPSSEIIIADSCTSFELTKEQYKKVKKSQRSGKYEYMDQDPDLKDIVQLAYQAAVEEEKREEYGHLVDIEVFPVQFEYPFTESEIVDCGGIEPFASDLGLEAIDLGDEEKQ